MAAKKSKKERMKEAASKKIDATAVHVEKAEEKKDISVAEPVVETPLCEAMTVKDTVMVVLYAVLLFLAMTVQTGKMSMVLIVLALASLIGKKPVENLKAHFSLPVIGLVAFAWMCGAASLYSRFGATAAAELYKLMASFSMAVILLARFEKKHVRGLLWGFATVCAVIALICLDSGSWGKLFEAFYALMERLGASYAHVYEQYGTRVDGIYNDANLTGALLGLAILVSVYLAHTADKLIGRFWALFLLGVSAVSFLAAMSRGAIVAFAMAVIIYVAVESGRTRTQLFFLLLTAGVASVAAGVVALMNMEDGLLLPIWMALTAGPAAFVLDWTVTGRLARLLRGHGKLVVLMSGGIAALLVVAVVMAFQMTEPYVFRGNDVLVRGMALSPGEYTVEGAYSSGENVRLIVQSRTEEGILTSHYDERYNGPIEDASFSIDEDAVWVTFQFRSSEGTVLESVALSDGTVIPLSYKYLPEMFVSRLQDGLLIGKSTTLRMQYMRDGMKLFKQSPLVGHGLGSTEHMLPTVQPFYYESLYIHNHIIQVMDEMGVVGLAAFLLLLFGSLAMLIYRRMKMQDSLAAALIACWVMMNLHSFMEINFSIRMFQCAAFFLLMVPVLQYAKPMPQRWNKLCGYAAALVVVLQLAVFGSLLQGYRAVQKEAAVFNAKDAATFMAKMQEFEERDPFDKVTHQLNFVANAVALNHPQYNGVIDRYVKELYKTGTYASYMGLARYYWLPQGNFEEVFACSRLAVKQVPSGSETWNRQVDFYRDEVLPRMNAENISLLVKEIADLEANRERYSVGRLDEIAFTEENLAFLELIRELSAANQSDDVIYAALTGESAEVTE